MPPAKYPKFLVAYHVTEDRYPAPAYRTFDTRPEAEKHAEGLLEENSTTKAYVCEVVAIMKAETKIDRILL